MQEILAGRVYLFGIENNGTAIAFSSGLPGYGFTLGSTPLTHTFEQDKLKDEKKFTVGMNATDEGMEIDLDFVPTAASKDALAALLNTAASDGTRANVFSIFPKPLSKVVLANFKLSAYNGTWGYIGGAKVEQSAGVIVKYSGLKLVRYADPAQMAILFP